MQILPPSDCPVCGSNLERVSDQLFCRNKTCPAQSSKKIEHFCKVMKLKGFGLKTLEKLELAAVTDLFHLTEDYLLEFLGSEKIAAKLYMELSKLSSELDITQFIAAMSIPLVGTTAGRKLAEVISTPDDLSFETCKAAGLGDKATNNLIAWKELEWCDYAELGIQFSSLERFDSAKPSNAKLADVCITGKLDNFKNRAEASKYLESLGFTVKPSVTKTVEYLICEDSTKTSSSSYKKAETLGIGIGSITELLNKFEDKIK